MATKILGIRIRTDSDLPERLKKLADMARVQYSDLLEKWIGMAERGDMPGKLPGDFIEKTAPSEDARRIAETLARVESLEARVATDMSEVRALANEFADLRLQLDEIADRVKILELAPHAAQAACIETTAKPEEPGDNRAGNTAPVSEPEPANISEPSGAALDYVIRLYALGKGLSLRKIAQRLNEEGIPPPQDARSGKWNHGYVDRMLERAGVKPPKTMPAGDS